jgi:hypothetical protein
MSSSKSKPAEQPNPSEEKTEKSRPIFSRRVWTGSGNVEVSIFDKMREGDNGEYRAFSIVAKRSWKEGDKYESNNLFRPEDLLPLSLFLQEAYSFLASEQSKR